MIYMCDIIVAMSCVCVCVNVSVCILLCVQDSVSTFINNYMTRFYYFSEESYNIAYMHYVDI